MPRLVDPDPLSQAIGRRVRVLRKERGLTLEKLAYESGTIAKGHLSDIENGLVRPTAQSLKAIADHLDLEMLDLVTFPEDGARSALVDATRGLTTEALDELLRLARQMPRAAEVPDEDDSRLPFRTVRPRAGEHFVTCVPLVGLDLAAGGFKPGPTDPSVSWVALRTSHKIHKGMFVARVVGRSMEERIPDGSYCLFRTNPAGELTGRTLLVQHRGIHDSDTGTSYTVKRLARTASGRVQLRPDNPDYPTIELRPSEAHELHIVAELIDVLKP